MYWFGHVENNWVMHVKHFIVEGRVPMSRPRKTQDEVMKKNVERMTHVNMERPSKMMDDKKDDIW